MPTKIRLSAIPGSNTSNIHAQGVLIARADFNHRENVVETREWKGSICAQALRKLAQETASLAVAERPGRYPDLIVIHARAEGRAPAGFNDLRHEMIFSRAEIDALAKPASTTPAAVAAAVALALLMSAGAAMAQNQQSPRNCQGNGGSTYCNQPVNQNIQQTWANGGAGGNASANGSGSASATINQRDRLQAPAVGIPSIAVGNNCGLAASAGGSIVGFSIGGSVAWEGESCKRIAYAFSLKELGQDDAALAMLCQDENVKKAMASVGSVCPGTPAAANALMMSSAPAPAAPAVRQQQAVAFTYNIGTGG